MSLNESYDLSRINQKRPDAMLVQLNKMQAQIEEMYSVIAAGTNGHADDTSNPHSVTKTQVGLGNVDNYATASQAQMEAGTAADKFATAEGTKQAIDKQIKGTSWTMENGLYIATDELRARDSSGLSLGDDSGNGLTILDGGNTSLTAGKYHSADSIRARDSGGLGLVDASGRGLKVNDGGIVTSAYQPGFRASVTSDLDDVTGDGTAYNLTGTIFTEEHDTGSCLSDGTFTAPVSSKKYYHGITLVMDTGDASIARLRLRTSNKIFIVCYFYASAVKDPGSGYYYGTWLLTDIDMDALDTAYWNITLFGGTKTVDILAGTSIFGGLAV